MYQCCLRLLSASGTVLKVRAGGDISMMRAELVKVELPKDEQRKNLQLASTPESVLILWGCPHMYIFCFYR